MSASGNRILVYRLGSLGDTVMALPCFHRVKESFPDADITLLTNRPVAAKAAPLEAILGKDYFFDRVLDYPVGTRNLLVLAALIWQIRALKIDTVVNITSTRSARLVRRDRWFFRAAGVRRFVGFAKEDIKTINPVAGETEWEATWLARRVRSLGPIALEADRYWDLRLTNSELYQASQVLEGIPAHVPVVAASIGTKNQSNDWEADNWLRLFSQLRTALPDGQLILIGAAEEAERSNAILDAWGGEGLNLCGKLAPRVSAAVLKRASVFVGHDSGPMHLAASVGVPCVGIFSARNLPRQWFPRGDGNRIIYHRTDCAGCGLEVCLEQRKKCILSITVGEVQQAILEAIARQDLVKCIQTAS